MAEARRPIVVLALGTRGDVVPMLALARGLRAVGRPVRLATYASGAALAAEHGLTADVVPGDPSVLFDRSSLRRALVDIASRATVRYWLAARAALAATLDALPVLTRDAALLVVGLASLWADQVADAQGVPCVYALLQPLGPTRGFAAPVMPFDALDAPGMRRLSHRLAAHALWWPWAATIQRWRRRHGLRGMADADWWRRAQRRQAPLLYGHSPALLACPPDWPAAALVTGAWHLVADVPVQPPPWPSGWPRVAVGFGSMARHLAPEHRAALLTALLARGASVIAQGSPSPALPGVRWLDAAPHAWLFASADVVVHHGGAGTTHAAARAGVPMVVAPVAVDQRFWGRRAAALGIAAPPQPLTSHAAADVLAAAAIALAHDHAARQRAAMLAGRMATEDGVAQAVARISAYG